MPSVAADQSVQNKDMHTTATSSTGLLVIMMIIIDNNAC